MTARPGPVVIVHVLDQSATPRRTSATAMPAIRAAGGTESSSARVWMSRSVAESGAGKRGERDRDDERHAKGRLRAGRERADARASRRKLQACKGERRDTDDEAAEHVRGEMASQVHA